MNSVLLFALIGIGFAIHECEANGAQIVAAAASQKGVHYSWGGGDYHGKSTGIDSGAHTVGFDCSGLAQYSVYKGTGKIIARTAHLQQVDTKCLKVAFTARQPGDLVFFGNPAHHVGIVASGNNFWQAPQTGDVVKESPITAKDVQPFVRRC